MNNEIIKFVNDDLQLDVTVSPNEETVWLTQKQMAELFDVKSQAITRHLKNIYNDEELFEEATCSKMEQVQIEGSRKITRKMDFYNLDAIIAVGYRVNSKKATSFRRWATSILKDYMIKGYAVNQKRLDVLNKTIAIQSRMLASTLNIEEKEVLSDVDQKFSGNQEIKTGANCFLNIYWFNGNFFLNQPFIDNDEIALYQECHDITESLVDGEMLYVGDEIHANWFKTFTSQTEIETSENLSVIQSRITGESYKYICVNSTLNEEEISEIYKLGNIIYEYTNELSRGKVVEVH